MGGKQMEGNNEQRRKKAREARERGNSPSEEGVTTGGSKQRKHLGNEDHEEKMKARDEGKLDSASNDPNVRPGSYRNA